jgi:predicted short-subunit dehydrogenase-like oxidoreductase (DUF2520 family)
VKRPDISIIGAGSVASHLGVAFANAGCAVRQVHSKSPAHAEALAKKLNARTARSLEAIEEADLLLIAVSDDAIATVASQLSLRTSLVVHTSGTIPLNVLAGNAVHAGVLYPLQTFSKDRQVEMSKVPLLLEANSEGDYEKLNNFARMISSHTLNVSSDDRLKYHLSAVIANNFTNHLLQEAHDYLIANNLDFQVLHPLVWETVAKALELGPANAQTGPARRNDEGTIKKHLEMLEGEDLKALYEFLTERLKKKT